MDSTPIYTELQKTLIDPEADHWSTSKPPEFASSLDANADHAQAHASGSHSGTASRAKQQPARTGGRRHRAED